MYHIIELHHELMKNRIEVGLEKEYVARTARVQRRDKDIESYLRQGYSVEDVSCMLGVHPNIVKARLAAIERDEEDRREFLSTGRMSSLETGGYVAIFQ